MSASRLAAFRETLTEAIAGALDVDLHPAVPVAMEDRITDALLDSGALVDLDALAGDEVAIERMARAMLHRWPEEPVRNQARRALNALLALLAERGAR